MICEDCDREFATKYTYRRHMAKSHPESFMSEEDDDNDSVHTNATDTSEENEYNCWQWLLQGSAIYL